MLAADFPELLTALADELTAVQNFVGLLQQEQTLLMENSIDQLSALTEQKSAQALHLNVLVEHRLHVLGNYMPGAEAAAVMAWFEANCTACLAQWQQIHDLTEQARQLNHINGELIQMKLRYAQQSLAVLTRAVSQANLYGPTGQTNFSQGSGRSLGSV